EIECIHVAGGLDDRVGPEGQVGVEDVGIAAGGAGERVVAGAAGDAVIERVAGDAVGERTADDVLDGGAGRKNQGEVRGGNGLDGGSREVDGDGLGGGGGEIERIVAAAGLVNDIGAEEDARIEGVRIVAGA